MAKDAKIGSLVGLVLIFIIAFVINGFTRSGKTADSSESSAVTADNVSGIDTPKRGVSDIPIQPITEWVKNNLTTEDERDTGNNTSFPSATPIVQEPITDGDVDVPESEAEKPSLPEVFYAVCEGDNLADIAKKFYGPEEGNKRVNVLRIFLANQKVLTSPHDIFVGQKIVIPPLDSLKPDEGLFSKSMFETVKSIGRSHLQTKSHTLEQGRLYAVKEGDSLWSISSTLLGDGSRYKEISKLNSGILKHEDRLAVGMRLRIPAQ
jgi:LysM repeat protein